MFARRPGSGQAGKPRRRRRRSGATLRGLARKSALLEQGRACYAKRQWADACDALSEAQGQEPLAPADLEKLAWSAGLAGRDDELLAATERLYRHHADAGEPEAAARWAFWSGFRLMSLGEVGRAGGWLARCERMLERLGKASAVQGYLALPACHRHLATADFEAACQAADRAAAIGEQFGEADLIALARGLQGRARLRLGQTERGLTALDESMLAATAGELSPLVTGLVYCTAIANCQRVFALDRSREWTSALSVWCDAQPQLVTFTGACQAHRAEILRLGGAWPQAIEQAQRATERSVTAVAPQACAEAQYEEAEVRRLRGELEAAEELYRSASQLGREPQPGLALLRVAQGKAEAAATAIRRLLGSARDPLERVRLLPAAVEILLATGDVEGARTASADLAAIAAQHDAEVLSAMAAHARGSVLLAAGDAQAALGPLRQAFDVWQRVGAPYIAARIRVELARACRALGDADGAALEVGAARDVFVRLGAKLDLAALDRPAPTRAEARPHGLTARELEVLRLVAAGKTNKAIAKQLFLSEKTVDRHVSNIFGKIDVASRAAATAFAYEHKLV